MTVLRHPSDLWLVPVTGLAVLHLVYASVLFHRLQAKILGLTSILIVAATAIAIYWLYGLTRAIVHTIITIVLVILVRRLFAAKFQIVRPATHKQP